MSIETSLQCSLECRICRLENETLNVIQRQTSVLILNSAQWMRLWDFTFLEHFPMTQVCWWLTTHQSSRAKQQYHWEFIYFFIVVLRSQALQWWRVDEFSLLEWSIDAKCSKIWVCFPMDGIHIRRICFIYAWNLYIKIHGAEYLCWSQSLALIHLSHQLVEGL